MPVTGPQDGMENEGGAPARRQSVFRRIPMGAAGPKQPVRVEDAYFDAPVCRNCAAPLQTSHCGQCGQKRANRLRWRDLRQETWQHWRLFEITSARTLWRLITSPGYVAREYVMGRRKDHMHPLKLLLIMVALMLVVLNYNDFFGHYSYSGRQDPQMQRMAELVKGYANWSFSTGFFAVFTASWLVYRNRLGYNAMEHAVLAVYTQIMLMAAVMLSLLPTLVWSSPAFVTQYTDVSKWVNYVIKALIVGVAFKQFFLVDLKQEWPRLAAAVLIYAATSLALLRFYAYVALQLIKFQMS